jgi:plastocyanin
MAGPTLTCTPVRTRAAILGVLIASAALAGCGDESDDEPAPPTKLVTMSERRFTPTDVNAPAGEPLAVQNAGSVGHDLKLRQDGKEAGGTPVLNPGQTVQLEILFEPGDYEMYCSVPGHEEAGMKGTFAVVD